MKIFNIIRIPLYTITIIGSFMAYYYFGTKYLYLLVSLIFLVAYFVLMKRFVEKEMTFKKFVINIFIIAIILIGICFLGTIYKS
ncbi:hypothetical protein D505_00975 [Elizabethkingia anophelis R26]|nr:hypothetical protein D505_00975 [Elizabethkingia anophelis R26]